MKDIVSPAISLSGCLYSHFHTKNGEYRHTSLGGKIVTKCVELCTIPLALIEAVVRGAIAIIAAIFVFPFLGPSSDESLKIKEIVYAGPALSLAALVHSLVSLFCE